MRLILFLIGGLVLANVVSATFIWPPSNGAPGPREPIVSPATVQGLDPWTTREKFTAPARDNIRKDVLRALDRPWAAYCTGEGHRELINAISNYYFQRVAEAVGNADTYGDRARRFAIEAWQTTDDKRIERLIEEAYGRGYFELNELQPYARKTLNALISVQVGSRPCAS